MKWTTYLQGASVLWMLQRVLGDDLMRYGLTLYLERFKYSNADTTDLWQSLSAASRNSSHPVNVKVRSKQTKSTSTKATHAHKKKESGGRFTKTVWIRTTVELT